jgi:hypothetical protein
MTSQFDRDDREIPREEDGGYDINDCQDRIIKTKLNVIGSKASCC